MEIIIKYINEDSKFWKHSYLIHLSEYDTDGLYVNADCEQDALDFAIDYATKKGFDGLFLSDDEVSEFIGDGTIGDYVSGGNEGRYLSSLHVRIEKKD